MESRAIRSGIGARKADVMTHPPLLLVQTGVVVGVILAPGDFRSASFLPYYYSTAEEANLLLWHESPVPKNRDSCPKRTRSAWGSPSRRSGNRAPIPRTGKVPLLPSTEEGFSGRCEEFASRRRSADKVSLGRRPPRDRRPPGSGAVQPDTDRPGFPVEVCCRWQKEPARGLLGYPNEKITTP